MEKLNGSLSVNKMTDKISILLTYFSFTVHFSKYLTTCTCLFSKVLGIFPISSVGLYSWYL